MNQKSFKFLLTVLMGSCKRSSTLLEGNNRGDLPPLNWYFFISCLMRSELSKNECETLLIELALNQMNSSQSAYSLIKNYTIDSNYFLFHLNFDSQLTILASLASIFERLNKDLLKRFITKLKLFPGLSQRRRKITETTQSIIPTILHNILNSINNYLNKNEADVATTNSQLDSVKHQIIFDYFVHLMESDLSCVSIQNYKEKELVDKSIQILIKFSSFNDSFIKKIINLDELIVVDNEFAINFYIRSQLVIQMIEPITILNDSINIAIDQIE
jgi:hypothetical protein